MVGIVFLMRLNTPLGLVPGIGLAFQKRLEWMGLSTVEDLITHYPFRYDDYSGITNALDTKIGEKVTLTGEVWSIKNIYTRSRKILTKALFNDGTYPVELTWFNQPYLTKQIKAGDRLQISGKVSKFKSTISILSPVWERLGASNLQNTPYKEGLHTGRLVPVYPETSGISSKWIRSKISQILPAALSCIEDYLPEQIKGDMLDVQDATRAIHFPKNLQEAERARQRLGFDELFLIQLATQKTRKNWQERETVTPLQKSPNFNDFFKSLPFQLTSAQKRVIDEVLRDLSGTTPMNRLIQGEVGSGKTVVAAAVLFYVYLNGLKSYVMAPTEILAFQHFSTIANLLKPLGINLGIYTGSKKNLGNPDIVIGTHALISEKLELDNIGLVVVDEQQRFGVKQRTMLRNKARIPHFLTMTATPIPRTVALTLYGDLDLSVIDELPKGRPKVRTYVVPSKKRADAYKFIQKKVRGGDQVYIITPLIEESETRQSAKAAKVEFDILRSKIFPDLRLGLLHGKLKSSEKLQAINDFKEGKTDILVSTSVVEVGVDVANATVMVIEGADRFGLAQLHQLRGRVGRGTKESFCLLFAESEESSVMSRLKNLERITDGLKLSELDMKIRGTGEVFGTKQSGRFEMKIASLNDLTLIEKTRECVNKILQDNPKLDKYPLLRAKLEKLAPDVMPD